jgi:AcrR family transcriptional regulator
MVPGLAESTTMEEQGPGAGKRTIASGRARKRCRDRERIMAAVLSLSGEIGYRQVTVRKVLAHGGGHVGQFYSRFRNLDDCFAAAYDAEAERLCTTLVDAAGAASGWREGTRAVLTELFRFAAERPLVTRALLCEVQVAGGDALAKHDEVLERLTAAIGSTCQEAADAEFASIPIAPDFVVGLVEGVICSRLARGEAEELPAAMPELMYLIVSSFLGRAAAREELRRPPS